jgi:hypothetical protein
VDTIFSFPVIGKFKLLHIILALMSLAFANSYRTLRIIHNQSALVGPPTFSQVGPHAELAALSKRWRAERNLWIAAFTFTAWAALASFYKEALYKLSLEERLADIMEHQQGSDFTFTHTEGTTTKEADSSGGGAGGGVGGSGGKATDRDLTPRSRSPLKGGLGRGGRPSASPPGSSSTLVHASGSGIKTRRFDKKET